VNEIIAHYGSDLVFTYSRYEIAPPGLQAVARRTPPIQIHAFDLTREWLYDRLSKLGPTEELAWHSLVERQGLAFHIPMIDFVDQPGQSVFRKPSMIASEIGLEGDFAFFETGRSFHGYFPGLIPQQVWPGYLGRLLLVNESDGPPVIDSRWVGHALVRGFAALRWSHNTNRYLAMPKRFTPVPHEPVSRR
jgi:hypothetical protein